jgi:hypothetical protein
MSQEEWQGQLTAVIAPERASSGGDAKEGRDAVVD